MPTRTVVVASTSGLHARPASLFTQAVAGCGTQVTISHAGGVAVDAASILFVMSLGVPHGAQVTLEAQGADADSVLDDLVALLSRNLDEEG
ncbi:MAG: HPr family phosphocarrier protein [Cellulomonadaceae bacterium]